MNALKKLLAFLLLSAISPAAFAITDAQLFAYAEASYPSLFSGTPASGRYDKYDYRYYPTSKNYLAVDTSGDVYILGPITGNAVTYVGPVAAYAGAVTAWEATPAGALGKYLGTYTGNWTNQTFGSTGPVSFQVSSTSPGVATMTVTLGGNVFGGVAPPAFTVTGTLNSQGVTLSGGPASFGAVKGTIGVNGQFNGTVTGIPGGLISSVSYSGTISGGVVNLQYTINFGSGSPATGILTATRQ